jgi:hypothetical protein
MLEQQGAKQKGFITLKEAGELAGYTPDYIGQLIRAGKIKGEQVYCNVAWMTTEDEVRSYLDSKKKGTPRESHQPFFQHLLFKYFLYFLLALCFASILFLQYVFYVSIDAKFDQSYISAVSDSE